MENKTEYKNEHAKVNYNHYHLKVPKHLEEVITELERQKNKNGYILELIEKDIAEKKRTGKFNKPIGNGKVRREEFIQNYNSTLFKTALGGKKTFVFTITDNMRHKEWWEQIFTEVIEDLENGGVIDGETYKNNIKYWERQKRLLEEFEPK